MPIAGVVVATDFSEHAGRAVDRAALLARQSGLESVRVVHVLQDALPTLMREWPGAAGFAAQARAGAEANLQRQVDAAVSAGARGVQSVVLEGPLVATLQAETRSDVLLLIGAAGAHAVRDFVFGSIAQRMVRKAAGPVLVVRKPANGAYRGLLVAIDFSDASMRLLAAARQLAPDAALHVVHALEYPLGLTMGYAGVGSDTVAEHRARAEREAELALRQLLADRAIRPASAEVVAGHPAHVLLRQAKAKDVDVIAVGKQGRSQVEETLLGSVTHHVLGEFEGDVLVMR